MYLLIGVSVQNNVAIFMNKYELAKKINELEGLTNDEKSELIKLLRSQKKYGLVWEDKPEDAEQRMVNEQPVLVEVPERAILSDDAEAPNHILIEGDNLEALTALSYTHAGKIDVIYIDPPYNTGNKDFVYNDDYVSKEDGYRHSMWLSFMKRRLKIAKKLLTDKGVIVISIDDNEEAQLKLLCDEVFGESNHIATLPTIMNLKGNQDEFGFAGTHEYTLVYCVCHEEYFLGQLPVDEEELDDWLSDEKGYYKKGANLKSTGINAPKEKRPNLYYPILVDSKSKAVSTISEEEFNALYNRELKSHNESYIAELREKYETLGFYFLLPITNGKGMSWRWSWQKVKVTADEIIVSSNGSDVSLYKKQRPQLGDMPSKKPKSVFYKPEYSSGNGKAELISVLGESLFGYPKPLRLISDLIAITSGKNSTILDFFAGSGTTLHATMQLNAKDGGHRQCILVTNNENGICENVTYERNRRVIQGYITPKGEKVPGLTRNNLRYYKTKFVPRDKSPKNLRNLMALSTDMLCIHNDTYIEKPFVGKNINNKIARYFESNDGSKRMLVIYRAEAIQALVELMKQEFKNGESKENGKLMVYVFSPNGYAYDDEFEDVADYVSLCAMPDAVLNAYRRVLPKKRQAQLLDDIAEETDSEARTVEESDLFQNQTYTMAASEIKDNREGGDE